MKRCLNCMNLYEKEYDVCPFCGYVNGNSPAGKNFLAPGTVINERYILGTVIGAGGFGITYIAWDNLLQVKIAVKEYFPSSIASRDLDETQVSIFGEANEDQYNSGLTRFLDEARRVAKFNKTENIVHVYDFMQANNTAYIAMEFLEGRTLKSIMAEKGAIDLKEALHIVRSIAAGLDKVHREGIIHRDISPDNIIIDDRGNVTLLDFGAARVFSERENSKFSVILKPSYAPPEQYLKENKQDKRTDVYALGAVLYHMITGKRPQDAASRLYEESLKRPGEITDGIPEWVNVFTMKCLSLNPDDRYEDMNALVEAIGKGEGIIKTEDPKESIREFAEKNKKGLLAGAAGLIVLVILIIAIGLGGDSIDISGVDDLSGEVEKTSEDSAVAEVSVDDSKGLLSAIENASYGDVIKLEPGNYDVGETLYIYNEGITVTGIEGKEKPVILNPVVLNTPEITLKNICIEVDAESLGDASGAVEITAGGCTMKGVEVDYSMSTDHILYGVRAAGTTVLEECEISVSNPKNAGAIGVFFTEEIEMKHCTLKTNDVGFSVPQDYPEDEINKYLTSGNIIKAPSNYWIQR